MALSNKAKNESTRKLLGGSAPLLGYNSPMERFFRSYKTEWMPRYGYSIFNEAKQSVISYILDYYNQVRPHRFNKGLAPNKKERLFWVEHETVAKIT